MTCAFDRGRHGAGSAQAWVIVLALVIVGTPGTALAQRGQTPASPPLDRLRDRGDGVATSMFGTCVRRGELLLYPFFEYYRDQNFEYTPAELAAVGEEDYRGRYRASEGLVFVAYGLTEDLAVEFEAAIITASLDRSASDPATIPRRIEESGLGDIEGQIRWRMSRETEARPELFSFAEMVVPHHRERVLIGTPGWEVKLGAGVVRGFAWGTLTVRGAIEYDEASTSHFDSGEYAVEYLRRLSRSWRLYAGIEGAQDEIALVGELQWHLAPNVFVKFNNGIGITSKATDWAPEVGMVFSFGRRDR